MNDKHVITQFFALLQAALWQRPAATAPFEAATPRWNELKRLAFEQTVAPLIYTGALTLPPALMPGREWLHAMYAFVLRTRQANEHINNVLARLATGFGHHGINPVVLKGPAYAAHYPNPELRQCGDIDLYVGSQRFDAACRAALQMGCTPCNGQTIKHAGCTMQGIRIELHRMPATLRGARTNSRFARWSHLQLTTSARCLNPGTEAQIAVPTPLFDVFFVFQHLHHHFIVGGVGMRQLCDWVVLLHTHHTHYSHQELKEVLHTYGLTTAWQAFGALAVNMLGLPPTHFPLYNEKTAGKAQKILPFILTEGNFGKLTRRLTQRPPGYWKGKTFSFVCQQKRFWKLRTLFPHDILKYQWAFITLGARQLVKDKLRIGETTKQFSN